MQTKLEETQFSRANLVDANILFTNLMFANLKEANLTKADLSCSYLVNANLVKANLSQASLFCVQLAEADLAYSILTGACIEKCNIYYTKNLNSVICDYIYLKSQNEERRPHRRNFKQGEFAKLCQKIVETVDLYFDNGIDWIVFLQSFNKLKIESTNYQLPKVQTIENKNYGLFLIRVGVCYNTNKEEWKKYFWKHYNLLLEAKEQKINIPNTELLYKRQENTKLLSLIKTMATQENKLLSDKNTTYNNENSELEQIILKIKALLEKQEQIYKPNADERKEIIAKETIKELENNSNLAKRIISASEKGFIAYIQARFISPVQSAFLAALEEWKPTKK